MYVKYTVIIAARSEQRGWVDPPQSCRRVQRGRTPIRKAGGTAAAWAVHSHGEAQYVAQGRWVGRQWAAASCAALRAAGWTVFPRRGDISIEWRCTGTTARAGRQTSEL